MRIIFENTIYSLFLYILIDKNWKERVYIFDKQLLEMLKEKSKNLKYFSYSFYKIKKNPFLFYKEQLKIIFLLIKLKLYLKRDLKIFGDSRMTYKFLLNKYFCMIEDGLDSYKLTTKNRFSLFFIVKKLIKLENIFFDGNQTSKFVRKIYMTGLAPIPEKIKDKVEIIDIKELWNKKTEEEKKEILDFFGFNLETISKVKTKKNIFFTQCLSENFILNENEKIDLYKKVLKNYDLKDLIIKTHPKEKTNYREYFPEALILDNVFPSEFFILFDVKFDKAITLCSTAALNLKDVKEIDFYGSEIHPKLLKAEGSYESIFKRNKFLNENDNDE